MSINIIKKVWKYSCISELDWCLCVCCRNLDKALYSWLSGLWQACIIVHLAVRILHDHPQCQGTFHSLLLILWIKLWKLGWHPGWSKYPVEEARCYSPGRILNASCIMPCQDSGNIRQGPDVCDREFISTAFCMQMKWSHFPMESVLL